ncbi:hypothetical protein [Nocardioides sp.]|uniref:hypothetical protein n=1 Tax=Nocardioides sp. TaxID=35761 RepID=UPI003D0FC07A
MTYTPRKRDRYRLAAAAITGATTVGALTATGWLGGVAAADYTQQQNERAAEQAAAAAKAERAQARYDAAVARQQSRAEGPRIVYKQRPVKHRVSVQYVTGATSTSTSTGTVTSTSTSTSTGTSTPSSNQGHQAPSSNPAPPPPPPPPPAPSSGS